jgi:hypothetical protein
MYSRLWTTLSRDAVLGGLRQRLKGALHVRELSIAAGGRDLQGAEHGHQRRPGEVGLVAVPEIVAVDHRLLDGHAVGVEIGDQVHAGDRLAV